MSKDQKPITDKEDIRQNPDPKISQDFENYPDGPGTDKTIRPKTDNEHKVADTDKKDGEKINIKPEERHSIDEQESDGSANAFDGK